MFIFLLIMNSWIPIIMIAFGMIWRKHYPKNINGLYGYRTPMSMKNDMAWEFAHLYIAKIWSRLGVVLLILSIVFMLIFNKDYERVSVWINFIQLAVLFLSIIPTEKALKKRFDRNGNPR